MAHAACNGQDALCHRLYSNVTFVGAHDSAFFGPFITQNQNINVSEQLALGVRFLQAQTHNLDGHIQMCHTSCLELNAGPLSAFLAPVKAFLDGNPNEVVSLLLTNGDAIPVTDFASVFEAAGLADDVFAPNGTLALDQWPTLQTMIDNGTRLVVWMGKWISSSSMIAVLLTEWQQTITPTPCKFHTFWTSSPITLRRPMMRPWPVTTSRTALSTDQLGPTRMAGWDSSTT